MANQLYDSLLRGGTLVDPAAGRNGRLDVAVKDGCIAAIEPDIARERIEADSLFVPAT